MSYLSPTAGNNRTTVAGTGYTGSSPTNGGQTTGGFGSYNTLGVSPKAGNLTYGSYGGNANPSGSTYVQGGTTGTVIHSGSTPINSGYVTGTTSGNYSSTSNRGSTYVPGSPSQGSGSYTGMPVSNAGRTSTYAAPTITTPVNRGSTYVQGGTFDTGAAKAISTYIQGGVGSTYIPGSTSTGTSSTYVQPVNLGPNPTSMEVRLKGEVENLRKRVNTLQDESTKMRNENMNMKNEINRVASRGGASFNSQTGKIVSHNEYSLQSQVDNLTKQNESLKADKERMSLVIHDLKRYAPDYKGDEADDPDLDGSFMNMKHKNVIESMEIANRQMKKKNKMLMEENDMLKTQVRSLCAADDTMNDKFLQTEVHKLQQKIRELKTKNNEMEIQLKTYESDKKLGKNINKADILNFDDGIREENERLKREMRAAYKKINDLESGDHALGRANVDKYKALTSRVNDLEREKHNLLNRLKDNNDLEAVKRSTYAEDDKDRELYALRRENDQLREELIEKNETIRRIQNNKGGDDIEAIQKLRDANERLVNRVTELQNQLNNSQSNMNMTNQSVSYYGGKSKAPGAGVLKSEFMDPYKESRFTLD